MAQTQNTSPPNFSPQWTCKYRKPKTPAEAQKLYAHIRTTAFLLDASSQWLVPMIPALGSLPQEVHFGLDAVVGTIIPALGDVLGLILGLYQVFLSALFGVPLAIIGWMILNLVIDTFIGVIPLVGDLLDVAFKANIYNLNLLEKELKKTRWAPVVIIPPSGEWIPRPKQNASGSKKWF